MMVDLVDVIWLVGAAISMGFLSYGGYLVIANMSVEEQGNLTRARLSRHWARSFRVRGAGRATGGGAG